MDSRGYLKERKGLVEQILSLNNYIKHKGLEDCKTNFLKHHTKINNIHYKCHSKYTKPLLIPLRIKLMLPVPMPEIIYKYFVLS